MEQIGYGVKGVVRKDDLFLVLVKPDGTFDLPGGRVENGETDEAALHREIDEETGLRIATNEQILKDAIEDDDEAMIRECRSHYIRYGDLFMKDQDMLMMIDDPTYYSAEEFGV